MAKHTYNASQPQHKTQLLTRQVNRKRTKRYAARAASARGAEEYPVGSSASRSQLVLKIHYFASAAVLSRGGIPWEGGVGREGREGGKWREGGGKRRYGI